MTIKEIFVDIIIPLIISLISGAISGGIIANKKINNITRANKYKNIIKKTSYEDVGEITYGNKK